MSAPGWVVVALDAAPPTGLVAAVAQPSPSPSPQTFDPAEVSPGLLGFVPVFLIALACVLLFLSLTKQLRKVKIRQAQLDAEDDAAGSPGDDDAGPAGRGTDPR